MLFQAATQAATQGNAWPVAAVRDTVAAIAQQPEYRRTLRESVLSRLATWLRDAWRWLVDLADGSVSARTITLVLLAILIILVVARLVIAARAAREEIPTAAGARRMRKPHDAWADAQRLAARGSFTDAAHALLAALLASFAARGELHLHSSKTAGDYSRELARRGSRASRDFDRFRRRYDGVIYGEGTCSAIQYKSLLADAQPLLRDVEAA